MRSTWFVAHLVLSGLLSAVAVAQPSPVASRLAAQNALFQESWETSLKLNPTQATAVGDYRYNDQLADYSLAAVTRRHDINAAYLKRIQAIEPSGFTEEDRTSHDLFLRNLQEGMDDYDLKNYEMPISMLGGPHTSLADLPLSMPFDSVKHYEDYIARLHKIPTALTQTEDVLRVGVKDHLTMVKFLAAKIPGQCQGIISADPFLKPTQKFPASFSDADKQRLTKAITDAVNTKCCPPTRSSRPSLKRSTSRRAAPQSPSKACPTASAATSPPSSAPPQRA